MRSQRGFTLIELLAVIAIIGILAALVAGTVTGIGQGGQTARLAGDQNSISKAADRFSTEALTGVYPVVSLDDTDPDLNPENDPRLAADLGVRLINFDAGLPQDANKTFVPNFLKEVPDSAGLVSWRIVESTGNAFFAEDGSFLARPSDARLDVRAGSSSGTLSSTVPTERSDYTLNLQMTKGDAAIELIEVTIPGGYNVGSQALSRGSVVGRLVIEFAEDNSWDSGGTITVASVNVTVASTNQGCDHPMAWQRIIDPEDGSETDAAVAMKLWQQTKKHLAGFPGRTRVIDEQQYLSFADYLNWRARRNKGDLKSRMSTGLVVSSWKQWLQAQGAEGVANLVGVTVGELNCYLDGYRFRVCPNARELAEEVRRRESLLESLQVGEKDGSADRRFRLRVEHWKESALGFLPEIYTLRRAINSISQRYFDGQETLFPKVADGFGQLLASVVKLVDIYNEALAGDIERLERLLTETGDEQGGSPLTIDLAGLIENIQGVAREQVTYMVDMAKADALDLLGETSQAFELVERHV